MATYYWVGGSGTWDNSSKTNWAASSGGAGGSGPPLSTDNVVFDANSGTAAVVSIAATAVCNNCTINKSDVNLTLTGSPTFAGAMTLTAGTITLSSYTLTLLSFFSSNTNVRSIAFGTGAITVTGNSGSVFEMTLMDSFTYTGTSMVNSTYAGATGTRTIRIGTVSGATESNVLNLNVSAGSDIVALTGSWRDVSFSGFSGTLNNAGRFIFGNLTLGSGMTLAAGTGTTIFSATSGPKTITSNGKTMDFPITFNGVGGSWTCVDALAIGSTRGFTLTNGTFNAGNQNVTIGTFALGSGTKTLTLGSGTWTVAGSGTAWNANTNVAGLTVSASTGTISMTSGSAKTFAGGGKTWPTLNQGGAGALTITQSNTFANITDTVQPATVTLTAGTTQTVTSLGLAGTSGNLITLNSSVAGTRATIYKASGSVSLSFVSIKDIAATGGANFNAFTSNGCVDGGNNTGWDFNSVLYPTIYTVRKTKRYFLN